MAADKMTKPEERLSMDLKRFGAPYSGKTVQNPATEEQLNDALTSMNECLRQEQKPSSTKESYTDTDLFL